MTDPQPTFNPDPTAPEHQTAAHWYMIMKEAGEAKRIAHEVGLLAKRQLEKMNALPDDDVSLFLTRKERRGSDLPNVPE